MKILLIEDDIELATSIERFFEIKGHNINTFYDGLDVINHIDETSLNYDLYLLDVNVPNVNGLEILKFIRRTQIDIPVIIITASLEIETLQKAFDYNCNEYIKKPFNLLELEIRLDRIFYAKTDIVKIEDDFFYDKSSMELKYKDESIELRKKEKLFLDILFKNIGFIVSSDSITDYVWEGEIKEKYPLRQMVNTIRQKLPYDIIKTEIGIGYKIEN